MLEMSQVPPETLEYVVMYLAHHQGDAPNPVPCPVRSIHMSQICDDQWDARFMDRFEKKTFYEIILAANYMGIESLLHLGCAKIATLIKALDQGEINRIIEEEEYRRQEQAQIEENKEDDDDDDDDDDNEDEDEDEEKVNDDDDEENSEFGGLVRKYSQYD